MKNTLFKSFIMLSCISCPLFAGRNPLVYAVSDSFTNQFVVADQVTRNPITGSPFPAPTLGPCDAIAMASDYSRVYMRGRNRTSLITVDVNTNNVLYTTTLTYSFADSFSMVLTKDNNTGYIAYSAAATNAVEIVTNLTSTPSAPGSFLNVPNAYCLAISRDGNTLYATSNSANAVYCYNISNPLSPVLSATIGLSSQGTGAWGLALTDTRLYVCNSASHNISVIDISGSPTLITGAGYPIDLTGKATQPSFIAIPASGAQKDTYAYVTDNTGNNVNIINISTPTPTIQATINMSSPQKSLTISADGSTALIPLSNSGKIATINTGNNTRGSDINTGTAYVYALAATPSIPSPNPPTEVTGQLTTTITECPAPLTEETFTISWQGSDSANVVSYNIYDTNSYTLVATVPAQPHATPYTLYTYTLTNPSSYDLTDFFVTAIDNLAFESTYAQVTLLPPITINTGSCSPSATGTIKNNVFLLQTQHILVITWSPSTFANIASYNIYNGTTLVGNVSATSPLIFYAFLANGDTGKNFSIAAVSSTGTVFTPNPVIVK